MLKTSNPVNENPDFDICPFFDLCKFCHPEPEMAEKRKKCNRETRRRCAVYWAFQDGYHGLDED